MKSKWMSLLFITNGTPLAMSYAWNDASSKNLYTIKKNVLWIQLRRTCTIERNKCLMPKVYGIAYCVIFVNSLRILTTLYFCGGTSVLAEWDLWIHGNARWLCGVCKYMTTPVGCVGFVKIHGNARWLCWIC